LDVFIPSLPEAISFATMCDYFSTLWYSSYEKGKPMIRMLMIAAMMLLGPACAGAAPEAEEPNRLSEDMEQPGGEEPAMGFQEGEEEDPLAAPGTLPEG
jgi:hypothetical protein